MADIREHPKTGIGKPELLRHGKGKFWSRRIDKKNRLIYHITDELITFVSCCGHYGDWRTAASVIFSGLFTNGLSGRNL